MFTQCSKCETVFRLSAEVLRAAGGQVRCGRCGEVFNALARLAEDGKAFSHGESSLDLETRADEILHTAAPIAPVETVVPKNSEESHAPGVEVAQLQILDPVFEESDLVPEGSLEFTLPPGELDRIFVATKTAAPLRPVAQPPVPPPAAPPAKPSIGKNGRPRPTPAERLAAFDAPATAAAPKPPAPRVASDKVLSGLEISEDVRQEMLAGYEHAELPQINKPRRELPRVVWLGAAFALGALLLVQILRDNGDWLIAHTPLIGGAPAAGNLSSYQLRQWGVTGEPGAKGTLRVRASILNAGNLLQPYPLLRVTLANRFGTQVGGREFEPAEYLGKPTARMMSPGEKVDATLDILDPGKDAEGFEIDVCVRNADKKIVCAGDAVSRGK